MRFCYYFNLPKVKEMYKNNKEFYERFAYENYSIRWFAKHMKKEKNNIIKFLAFGKIYNREHVLQCLDKYFPEWENIIQNSLFLPPE